MVSNQTYFYAQPKFLVGSRALEHIPIELDGFNATRPMVITSTNNNRRIKLFINALAESNITVGALVDDVLPYVNANQIVRLAGLFTWRECNSIIALGGEGVMDIAKAMACFLSQNNKAVSFDDCARTIPLLFVSTHGVDGLEVTRFLNYDGKRLISDAFYPDLVCIDTRMVRSCRKSISIFDASLATLAYCIEASSFEPPNPFLDASAYSAIQLIANNLPNVAQGKKDAMANIALYNAIAIGGTVKSNAPKGILSHSVDAFASETGISPNLLAALLLPSYLEAKSDKGLPIRSDLLLALVGIDSYSSIPGEAKVNEAIRIVKQLCSFASTTLADLRMQKCVVLSVQDKVIELVGQNNTGQFVKDFLQKAFF